MSEPDGTSPAPPGRGQHQDGTSPAPPGRGQHQAEAASAQTPDSRATTFQPVEGPSQHYSGEALLVTGYAILWVILLSWVGLVWRKQRGLDARLAELEREIDKAAASSGDKGRR
jgi:hypothetical protein